MFLDELSPLFNKLMQHPLAFTGGLVSGVLRLNPSEDPLKSWLEQQSGKTVTVVETTINGRNAPPQQIVIE